MELIMVPGYTQEEKIAIAKRHLLPKQLKEHGLTEQVVEVPCDSLKAIISNYTREGWEKAEESSTEESKEQDKSKSDSAPTPADKMTFLVTEKFLTDVLGPPVFESEVAQRLSTPGVAVGLAWTAMGGEIMFVEATRWAERGKITLTGQLGDVMKESAQLALSWLRSRSVEYCLTSEDGVDLLERTDVHIHFPAGAVGKDGPSAGVTIVSVLVSLFSGRCTRSDTAMTGEINIERPCSTWIFRELPDNVKDEMNFILANRVEDVLRVQRLMMNSQEWRKLPADKL
ncbi:Lon protease-like protein 2 [Desmophyllum pertusum]|uniref:Lon protease-like protein 2 n=1 Tax=Desmophyllum pertusum TaxID=174260 RepID=A0A9X0CM49_9CNID|nr:Lon protease-like protein 2 [Desmophyllum pertusum]